MKLTKSKYTIYCLCPRKAWLDEFFPKPQLSNVKRTDTGNEVDLLARDYFGKDSCSLADSKKPSTKPGLYAQYPLRYKDLECFVDILRINEDGSIDIYEVKSTTGYRSKSGAIEKKYLEDVSFQYYAAYKIGLTVKSINIIYLNNQYIYMGGDYDLSQLFKLDDLTAEISETTQAVEEKVNAYLSMTEANVVECPLSGACNEYNGCQYLQDCKDHKGLPKAQSVYDLYGCQSKGKYIEKGILSFKDLIVSPYFEKLSAFNQRMVVYSLQGIKDPYVNRELLQEKFLNKIKFPLYFFDFETVADALPVYPNSRPYQQIPFQYSLHVMDDETQSYKDVVKGNKYFLGDGVKDPREELIKQMIVELGDKGSIMAYNMSFEKERITELMRDYPKYEKKLAKIHKRFIDLADVFDYSEQIGWSTRTENATAVNRSTSMVYHPLMGPSTSIKKILPALYPNDPDLDYSKLGQVQHGDQASESYQLLKTLSPNDEALLRNDMLNYCCLDTKAMVAIYFKLLGY